jgi:hypothetical protein
MKKAQTVFSAGYRGLILLDGVKGAIRFKSKSPTNSHAGLRLALPVAIIKNSAGKKALAALNKAEQNQDVVSAVLHLSTLRRGEDGVWKNSNQWYWRAVKLCEQVALDANSTMNRSQIANIRTKILKTYS